MVAGLVLDTSIAATWLFEDEASDESQALLRSLKESGAYVPSLFWHEARNMLINGLRRKRLLIEQLPVLMAFVRALPLQDCGAGPDNQVLNLAARHNLTAYDAAYVELAMSKRATLATKDKRMTAAAELEGVAAYRSNL
jgi:predicted nucleic acid-binding protein